MSFKCNYHSRTGNVLVKLSILNDYPLGVEPVSPTGQFKYSLDSFYVTESPLTVTNKAELATFYLNIPVLMIIP